MKGNVVNLLGGPGIGKSTLAATIYVELKRRGMEVEYVAEYPKELVYQNNTVALSDQVYVFAHQYHKIWTAAQHNELIITDSPILLSAMYNPDTSHNFQELIVELHSNFNSMNVVLKRTAETHSMVGRVHSLTESVSVDNRIRELLDYRSIEYVEFDPVNDNIEPLVRLIIQEYDL